MFPAIITLTVLIFPLMKGTLGDPHKCTVENACVAENAIGVDYDSYNNCVCDCRPGWTGDKCGNPTRTVNYPNLGYSSELTFSNPDNVVNYYNAANFCLSLGDGWDIATIISSEACRIASYLTSKTLSDCWLSGTDVALRGTWVWQTGRQKGKAFFVNGTQVSGMFAEWSTPPTDQRCLRHTKHWMAVKKDTTSFIDYYDEYPGYSCLQIPPNCVLCERSPCVKKLDCVIANTKNVSGYYPCVCECYSGYSGNDCSIKLVNSTTTLSPVPTIPTTTTLSTVPTIPSTSTLSTVPTIPSTSTLSTVPTTPTTTTLSTVPTMHNTSTLSPVPTTHSTTTLSPVPTMSSISTLSPVPTMSMLLVITVLLSYSHVLSRLPS